MKETISIYYKEFIKQVKIHKIFIIAFALYMIFSYIFLVDEHTNCFVQYFIGYPDPMDGMSRAYRSLFHFDIVGAFTWHPLFWTVPIITFIYTFREFNIWGRINYSKIYFYGIIALYFIVYIIRMIYMYPHTEPMTYHEHNLLSLLADFYKWIFSNIFK